MTTVAKRWTQTLVGTGLVAQDLTNFFTAVNNNLLALGFTLAPGATQGSLTISALPTNSIQTFLTRTYAFPTDTLTATRALYLRVMYTSNVGRTLGFMFEVGFSNDNGATLNNSVVSLYNANNSPANAASGNSSLYLQPSCLNYLIYDSDAGVLHVALGIGFFKHMPTSSPEFYIATGTSQGIDATSMGYTCFGRGAGVDGLPVADRVFYINTLDGRGLSLNISASSEGYYTATPYPACCTRTVGDLAPRKTNYFIHALWNNYNGPRGNNKLPVIPLYAQWADGSFSVIPQCAGIGVGRLGNGDYINIDLTGAGAQRYTYLHGALYGLQAYGQFPSVVGGYTYHATTGIVPLVRWDGTLYV